jgi:hypothetical protein
VNYLQPPSSLGARVRAHLGLKLGLAFALNLWALVPYFWLQRNNCFPVTTMPQSLLDVWLGFGPQAIWIYLSLFLLMPIAPMQMDSTHQLRRYALGVVAMSFAANFIFLFWPTAVARGGDGGANMAYRALVSVDMPLNAFPSLHAAMAVYSALCCEQISRSQSWRFVIWSWVLAIVWAMLSTKQHVALDAVGGGVLGLSTYWWAFRNLPVSEKEVRFKTKPLKRDG